MKYKFGIECASVLSLQGGAAAIGASDLDDAKTPSFRPHGSTLA
jgi:hypothetical protein